MKKFCIISMMICLSLLLWGCGEVQVGSSGGIDNIAIDSTTIILGSNTGDTCSVTYWLSFDDPNQIGDTNWYWGEIGHVIGNDTAIYNDGSTLKYHVTANYFEFPNPTISDISVAKSTTAANSRKQSSSYGQLTNTVNIPTFGIDCYKECCTDKLLHRGWYYVSAKREEPDLIAAKAQIKSRYGQLCGETYQLNTENHQCVYVNISYESLNPLIWAQIGYRMKRFAGDTNSYIGYYSEVNGDYWDVKFEYIYHNSFDGNWNTYELELDPTQGVWRFYYNGYENPLMSPWPSQNIWTNKKGTSVQWTGEIYGIESDLAGTLNDPCSLNVCQYRTINGSYYDADFYDTTLVTVGGTNLNEWKIQRISQNGIKIWDVNPLP